MPQTKESGLELVETTMVAKCDDKSEKKGANGDQVYTVSVTEGITNRAFKGDEDLKQKAVSNKLPPEDPLPEGKFKLSKKEKWRILKNIAMISLAFMVQFTAFQGTANLQSSINAAEGLGTVSLSAIYAALVVSCIFVPTFLIKKLTVKWTLCLSLLCYAPYIGSQFYPRFYTLVPAGLLLGAGAAPMWAAKATYLTQVGGIYAKLTDQPVDGIIVRFFGFFFLAWQTAELWGNLISSLVLSSGAHGGGGSHNASSVDEEALRLCGANFCVKGGGGGGNLERPPDSEIYTISAIYLACIFVAALMIAFLVDPLTRYGERQKRKEGELSGLQLLAATAHHLKKPFQQLLIPITIYIGIEQAFIGAEFTQAYIACALGISSVGYVMICFGVVNAICSLLFGSLMKYTGRFPLMLLGAIVHGVLIGVLLYWRPHPDNPMLFFAISGLWGVGDAVWQTQVNGIYGTLFRRNKEAAFSNYRLWESAGFVIAYAYSTHMCEMMKLYVMGSVLVVGIIGYFIVEYLHKRKKIRMKKQAEEAAKKQAAAAAAETDDERDDVDDDMIITHL